ncbi:MAG: hypothetical protein IKZ51_00745 [Bacteroidales bacterium]|nr:hypothetical protein [Bacteroidales bacterium]
MNRIVLLLSFCLSFCVVSCTKEIFTPGYISVDGERRLDLQCGYEADMSGIGLGKNNWHLFTEDIEIKSQSDINQCSVSVWSAPQEPVITSMSIYGIPGYGNLMLEFSGSDSKGYKIKGQFAEQMGTGQGTQISGSAKVNTFSCNSSSTRLNLDVTLDLDKTIRIVFNGSTPNDGLAWMMY